ncbi:MAG: oligopeptide transporter, OPT family [Deltaproteobacteria bacterium CG07_land_8_20_14_0_80_38_7]|nr:MAG: oligopeptide transporter, OPT family [Deltaproteobacteria bacterium CG07_land_8_20_14_0_80_38_7]
MEHSGSKGLPENAYTELAKGEKYLPVVPSEKILPEVSLRSVFWGILFGIIFSTGTTFLTLKIAQGMEAAIPIAIIAVGLSYLYKRKSSILENVMIQSIGSAAPAAAAGIVFVIPALYILKLDAYASFFTIFFACIAGGLLGIVFLIPFRKHYVSEMHGKYPFPEATATTEVLVAGKEGGEHAKVLLYSVIIGGVYDFMSMTLGAWREVFTTKLIPSLSLFTDKLKMIFDLNTGAAVIGMGYIIGIRYCLILAASSFLSFIVLVPLVAHFGANMIGVGDKLIGEMSAGEIFSNYVKFIGIGVIAMAAILGVLKSSKIVVGAIKEGVKEIFKSHYEKGLTPRTGKDIKMSVLLVLLIAGIVSVFVYFRSYAFEGVLNANVFSFISLLLITIISFLFTTVAIWCIAVTARNPISGMTIVTLAISSLCILAFGLGGAPALATVLIIGAIVCTALAVSGSFISDLKVGYWIGSTPRNQERWKFVGILTGAVGIAFVVIILNKVYGFAPDSPNPLPAPQANAMAAVVQMMMGNGHAPWLMYALGGILAILFEMMGIPPLAAGLGMYLPMNLNMSVLVGGLLSHFVSTSGKTKQLGKKRGDKGTLIASGFIAGGAVMGVFGAILMYIQQTTGKVFLPDFGFGGNVMSGNIIALCGVAFLSMFILWDTLRVK